MLEPMHAAVGKPNGGAPSKVLTGKIHVVCHNKTQKLFARHCVAKQCLGSDGEGHTQRDNRPPSYLICAGNESFWQVTIKECLALNPTEVQSMLEPMHAASGKQNGGTIKVADWPDTCRKSQ